MAQKRNRSANFSVDEKILCLSIIKNYKGIIENKVTNAVSIREKDLAWDQITKTFNAQSPTNMLRNKEMLKTFYENKKREVKKAAARERIEMIKTGGGPPAEKIPDMSYDIMLDIINKKSVHGMYNPIDGNSSTDIIVEVIEDGNEENVDPNEDVETPTTSQPCTITSDNLDWGDYKVQHLKTPVNKKLCTGKKEWTSRRRPLLTNDSCLTKKYEDVADVKVKMGEIQLKVLQQQLEFEKQQIELHKEKAELEKKEILSKLEEIELRKESVRLDIIIKKKQIEQLDSLL